MADANYFDPEEPIASDTQSTDNSKSGVRKAWDAFSSRPENNAALLQFGIAMMQPAAKGQGFLGQVGNSIGEAGEAATRNIGAQEAQAERESRQEERASTAEYRKAQSKAAITNADAYSRQVNSMGAGGANNRQALSQVFRTQQAFRTWLAKPEDTTGMQTDPLLSAVQKEFPDIKTKGDLVRNQKAQQRAYQLYTQQFSTEPPDETATPTAPPAAAQPPNAAVPPPPTRPHKTFFNKQTGAPEDFEWDGTKWIPSP